MGGEVFYQSADKHTAMLWRHGTLNDTEPFQVNKGGNARPLTLKEDLSKLEEAMHDL